MRNIIPAHEGPASSNTGIRVDFVRDPEPHLVASGPIIDALTDDQRTELKQDVEAKLKAALSRPPFTVVLDEDWRDDGQLAEYLAEAQALEALREDRPERPTSGRFTEDGAL